MHSSTPSYLWGGGAEAREAAAAVSVVPGPFCGGDREVGDVTEGCETEDPGRAKVSVWQRDLELREGVG